MSAAASTTPQEPGSFGWLLLETTLVLAAICLLAYVVIRFLARRRLRGWSARGSVSGLRILERIALGPRQSLHVVQAGSRVLLLGTSDAGVEMLCELDAADWTVRGQTGARFKDLIEAGAAERGTGRAPVPPAEGER